MKSYIIKTTIFLILLFLGYVVPSRHYLYPFVKFPMYGYSKSKDEMFQKHRKTILYFENKDSLLIDPFDFGFSREYFSKTIVRPFLKGNTQVLDKLISNTVLIYPNMKLLKIEIEEITYEITDVGLIPQKVINKTKNVH